MMKRDPIWGAVKAGIISTAVKNLFHLLLASQGFGQTFMWQVSAGTFVAPDRVNTLLGIIIGIAADITVGSSLAVLFYLFLKSTGRDHVLLKGMFFALASWLVFNGVLLALGASRVVPTDEVNQFVNLLNHVVFGLAIGYAVPRLSGVRTGERLYPVLAAPARKPQKRK